MTNTRRYYGSRVWQYRIPQDGTVVTGRIELPNAGNGYQEDESHVRFLLRHQLGLKRLSKGTVVEPVQSPLGKTLVEVFATETPPPTTRPTSGRA